MNNRTSLPRFGGAIMCDSIRQSQGGKFDCYGVFTSFMAWDYPTSVRSWNAVVTINGLARGTHTITASIIDGRHRQSLAQADVETSDRSMGVVIHFPLIYRFPKEGAYTIEFALLGSTTSIRIPATVDTQPWPHFTRKDLDILRRSTDLPKSMRTNVLCAGCSKPYVFEATPLPDYQFVDGVMRFPEDGTIDCTNCGHKMCVKDIEGQILSSIKSALMQSRGNR